MNGLCFPCANVWGGEPRPKIVVVVVVVVSLLLSRCLVVVVRRVPSVSVSVSVSVSATVSVYASVSASVSGLCLCLCVYVYVYIIITTIIVNILDTSDWLKIAAFTGRYATPLLGSQWRAPAKQMPGFGLLILTAVLHSLLLRLLLRSVFLSWLHAVLNSLLCRVQRTS